MSTRPNRADRSRRRWIRAAGWIVTLGILTIGLRGLTGLAGCRKRGAPDPAASNAPPPGRTAKPARNPIERMLAPDPDVELRDGVAVLITVDVSGSMRDAVADGTGTERPKIDVARDCVRGMITRIQSYVAEHPGTEIRLGIHEFSSREYTGTSRVVVPLMPADRVPLAKLDRMRPDGGTPIGDAIIAARRALDASGLRRQHLLVITDGENTQGYDPGDVTEALNRFAPERRPSLYFVAFDIAADHFAAVREGGGLVLAAANATELDQTLGYVLTGKILAEQPEAPGATE